MNDALVIYLAALLVAVTIVLRASQAHVRCVKCNRRCAGRIAGGTVDRPECLRCVDRRPGLQMPRLWRARRGWRVKAGASTYYGPLRGALGYAWRSWRLQRGANAATAVGRQARIEHDGLFWRVVFPAPPGEGMGTEMGPYLTRTGARLGLWFTSWLDRR